MELGYRAGRDRQMDRIQMELGDRQMEVGYRAGR